MTFFVLFRKEWMELVRTNRWLLVPLLFLLLCLVNVVVTKELPNIVESSLSNLPKGTILKIPPPTGFDALSKTISQVDLIGILAIILLFMGSVAGERASGVSTTVLVKPVSPFSYLGAKLLMALLVVSVSFVLSMVACWYYAEQLFVQGVNFLWFVEGVLSYLPKLLLVVSIVCFFSALTKSSTLAGGLSLAVTVALSLLGMNHWLQTNSPMTLSNSALEFFRGSHPAVLRPVLMSVVAMLVLYLVSVRTLNRREA